jgi:hypothetical protein
MRVHEGQAIPILSEGECSLIHVETWTGKVLELDGKNYHRSGAGALNHILIFDSLEEAEEYGQTRVRELPDVECHVFDHKGKHLRSTGNQGKLRKRIAPGPVQWWKFWRWRLR